MDSSAGKSAQPGYSHMSPPPTPPLPVFASRCAFFQVARGVEYMGGKVIRRAKSDVFSEVFMNEDLLRCIAIGNIGISTYLRLAATCKGLRTSLYKDEDIVRAVALFTGALTKHDICHFFVLKEQFVRLLPFVQLSSYRLYGVDAIDYCLHKVPVLDAQRAFEMRDIRAEARAREARNLCNYGAGKKRKAREERWEREEELHRRALTAPPVMGKPHR